MVIKGIRDEAKATVLTIWCVRGVVASDQSAPNFCRRRSAEAPCAVHVQRWSLVGGRPHGLCSASERRKADDATAVCRVGPVARSIGSPDSGRKRVGVGRKNGQERTEAAAGGTGVGQTRGRICSWAPPPAPRPRLVPARARAAARPQPQARGRRFSSLHHARGVREGGGRRRGLPVPGPDVYYMGSLWPLVDRPGPRRAACGCELGRLASCKAGANAAWLGAREKGRGVHHHPRAVSPFGGAGTFRIHGRGRKSPE